MGTRETRQARMADLIFTEGGMSVAQMSELFGVSAVTIRTDLQELERSGAIIRTLGGAVAARPNDPLEDFRTRSSLHSTLKRLIGQCAAGLVRPGESVIIDAGSTTLEMVRHLDRVDSLSIITPALNIALEAVALPRVTVIVPGGGILNSRTLSLGGTELAESFDRLHADRYFMGIRGLDLERGLTDTRVQNVRIKQAMMRAAREVIVLADSSKLGKVSLAQVAPVEAVQAVVTDEAVEPSLLEGLRELGLQTHVARSP